MADSLAPPPGLDDFLGSQTAPVAASSQNPGEPPGLDDFISSEKYETPGETVKAGVRGIAKGLIGSTATHAIERYGGNALNKDIRESEAAHPIAEGVGQAVGLGTGLVTGTGEAAVMTKAGEFAAEAAGLAKPISYAAKVGSAAVKQAAEMAVLQSDDEVAKMVVNDPDASAQSAIANIGLATALGGAGGAFITGAVSPLWSATVGKPVENFLSTLTSKLGGREGVDLASRELAEKTGIQIPDILKAKIDDAPGAAESFSKLSQTDTTWAGKKTQEALSDFHRELADKTLETLGHEGKYINEIPELDKYGAGQKIGEALHADLKEQIKPINDGYEAINTKFKNSEVTAANIHQTAEAIAQKSLEQGWHKAESDAQTNLVERVLKKLPEQATAEDLKKFITNLRQAHPFGSETYATARDLSKIISDAQGRAVTDGILAKGGDPALAKQTLDGYQALKGQYAGLMDQIDGLNEHLHVGKYDGPKSFLDAVKEMSTVNGEGILSRLSGQNKANALEAVAAVSPKALAEVRQHHVDKLLKSSLDAVGNLSPYKFAEKYEKLTPQIKNLIASPEAQSRLENIGRIADKLRDDTHNWSNTARTADKLAHGATSPLVLLAGMLGHGSAAIVTHLGGLGLKEGSDAIKLGMLKFLGSEQPIKSEGFKAMVEFLHNTAKGESMMNKAVEAVFKPGAQVLTDKMMPAKADRDKLDKIVTKFQENPEKLASMSGHTGHYMPGHQVALTQSVTNQLQYLTALKPQPTQAGPLDKPFPPSPGAVNRYHRALDIATNPTIVLHHAKEGTLQPSDIQDIHAMTPALHNRMVNKLSNQMNQQHSDEEHIPYHTRMGISLLMGQAVDSSMQASNIMAAQPKPKAPLPQQNGKMSGKASTSLNKMSKSYQTPGQASESDRSSRD